jgi:thiosulfate reductase cytochrome b subunit
VAESATVPVRESVPRHSALVRATHWITVLCFLALLVSGVEIVISHPRFYWGEVGNVNTPSLFDLPIPASRAAVRTGYGFVLPDQNGWSRSLHFQTAWVAVLTGLLYAAAGVVTRHFRKNLMPSLSRAVPGNAWSYNPIQRLAYLCVIFILFPLMIWTGFGMSPAIVSAFPLAVTVFGGQQSARTIHFFVGIALVLFLVVHVVMVYRAGFAKRTRAMITGRADREEEP